MVDYYKLPMSGDGAWPGRHQAVQPANSSSKAEAIEDALLRDVEIGFGRNFNRRRFVPFVVMHEFEGLLFSNCDDFARGIGRMDLKADLAAIRDQFGSPEEIDDGPETAPSVRIRRIFPAYDKPLLGTLAALEIGLQTISSACPHFSDWLDRLVAVGGA